MKSYGCQFSGAFPRVSFTLNLIITAITVFTLGSYGSEINYLIGFAIFPFIGICTTPNIVKHVKNDTSSWKKIFYKNGNLYTIKNSPDYYRVKAPVEFEKKILSAVRKHQILNVLVVIGVMLVIVFLGINYMTRDHSYTDNLIKNLIITRNRRNFGFIFFMMIFFLAFAIPIIAYYVSNALKKIRVVRDHEYIAYHAIVPSVNNGRIGIYHKGKQFTYKYCTCVGIKEKEEFNLLLSEILVLFSKMQACLKRLVGFGLMNLLVVLKTGEKIYIKILDLELL